ncbi:MAG: ribose 5-phosphate isomerase [Bacteroidota bacterium]|jgi:ribose 5-phosphate isomerase B
METIFNLNLPIAIGCDHAAVEYKDALKKHLEAGGYTVQDFGTHSAESVDYPDYAHPVASMVEKHEAAFGILLCGSANGVTITANKHQQIRAALCWQREIAELARAHNNANILCLPARFTSYNQCREMLEVFMTTPFEGGRHENRVKKIGC